MPSVTILRPGVQEVDQSSGWFGWNFNAEVDGQVGVAWIFSPSPLPENEAAARLKGVLERHPDKLNGICFTETPAPDIGMA